MSEASRIETLKHLLDRKISPPEANIILSRFDFDSEPLVEVERSHILKLLMDFIEGFIDSKDVEDWADAVELRDDLFYDPQYEEDMKDIVHDLSNPILSGPLTNDKALEMISVLQRDI